VFSPSELQIIHAALLTICPKGGGSEPHTLALKIEKMGVDFERSLELSWAYSVGVVSEAVEAGFVHRAPTH
jgi:hypothetical protein